MLRALRAVPNPPQWPQCHLKIGSSTRSTSLLLEDAQVERALIAQLQSPFWQPWEPKTKIHQLHQTVGFTCSYWFPATLTVQIKWKLHLPTRGRLSVEPHGCSSAKSLSKSSAAAEKAPPEYWLKLLPSLLRSTESYSPRLNRVCLGPV